MTSELTLEGLDRRLSAVESTVNILNDPNREALRNIVGDIVTETIPDISGPLGGFIQALAAQAGRTAAIAVYDELFRNDDVVPAPVGSGEFIIFPVVPGFTFDFDPITGSFIPVVNPPEVTGAEEEESDEIPSIYNPKVRHRSDNREQTDEGLSSYVTAIMDEIIEERKQRLENKGDEIVNQDFAIARDKVLREIMHLYAEVTNKIADQRDNAIAAVRAAQPKQSRNADNPNFQTRERTTLD